MSGAVALPSGALLLDTHAFLWWLAGSPRLSPVVQGVLAAGERLAHVSAASAWEIATKHRLGKLAGVAHIVDDLEAAIRSQGFAPLPITLADASLAGALPGEHRDPFDRMLAAQAIIRGWDLASGDALLDGFGVRRLW